MQNDNKGYMQKPPPGWGNDSVTKFFENSRENMFASFHNTKNLFRRIIMINDLFESANDYMKNSKFWFELLFFLKSHSSFLTAARLASSGQAPETFMVLRGALESSLYGFYIQKNPGYEEIWLKRPDSKENKNKMKKTFEIKNTFDALNKINPKLKKTVQILYERTIDYGGHPNPNSLLTVLQCKTEEEKREYKLEYLSGNPLTIMFCLKSTAQVGIACLKLLKLVMPIRFELTGLNSKLDSVAKGL